MTKKTTTAIVKEGSFPALVEPADEKRDGLRRAISAAALQVYRDEERVAELKAATHDAGLELVASRVRLRDVVREFDAHEARRERERRRRR